MNPQKFIYLDYAAATPVRREVFEAMEPYFSERFFNPSSIYGAAQKTKRAMEDARRDVATALRVRPEEIIFTGSGTESDNLAIFGVAALYKREKNRAGHIVATNIEHDAVLKAAEALAQQGWEATHVSVETNGIVSVDTVRAALRKDTALVSVMHANNEIGTIQPIVEIAKMVRAFRGDRAFPLLHTDACQSAGYLDVAPERLGVDLLTQNGGKLYGPKGVGALYVRGGAQSGIKLQPLIFGGGQERGIRSGTENVAAIIGMAKALQLAQAEKENEWKRLQPLRDRLIDGLLRKIPDCRLNGDRIHRLPNNVNVSCKGLEGETILLKLDERGILVSSGSACATGSLEPSHVIRALGYTDEWTHGSVRFTLGKDTTAEEIEHVVESVPPAIAELRESSPFF